ncbi:MAG: DUF4412 domain-containing protein [Bacteroidota bacterium]
MQKLSVLIIALLFSLSTTAQFGGMLRKAKNRLVDRVVERTVEKTADRVAEKVSSKATDKIMQGFDGLFSSGDSIRLDSAGNLAGIGSLSFLAGPPANVSPNPQTLSFTLAIDSPDGKIDVDCAFEAWKTGVVVQFEDGENEGVTMKILHDLSAKTTTFAQEVEGEWQAFRIWMIDVAIDPQKHQPHQIQATGRTKTIEGHHCKEYIIQHEAGTSTVWASKEIEVDITRAFVQGKGLEKAAIPSLGTGIPAEEVGVCLAGTMTDKKGRTSTYQLSNIKTDAAINHTPLDLSGIPIAYDLTNMQQATNGQ